MSTRILNYTRLITHSIPSLIAIALVELMNVEMYIHGPVSKSVNMLLVWLGLQTIAGFLFGYISDKHYRKKTLLICQILGVFGGIVLSLFGFEKWVIVLIALSFNPLPVARAAFLDNFPTRIMLRLIAITYLAQQLPWVFFKYLAQVPYKPVVLFTIGALSLNTILTWLFFKDSYDHKHNHHDEPKKNKTIKFFAEKNQLLPLLISFILAETTFYILWVYLEYDPKHQSLLSATTLGTVIGIVIAMLYNRLPHIAIITLFYSIGAGLTMVAIFQSLALGNPWATEFLSSMTFYTVVGGLYLPFVTEGVIRLLGTQYKGFGSALVEFGDTIASFIAPLINLFIHARASFVLIIVTILYMLASILMKYCEKFSRREA